MSWERFIQRRHLWPVLLLAAVAGVTALGAPHALVPDNAITVWFMPDDPVLENYRRFHANFGNDEVVLIQVEESEGVFTGEALTRLQRLTRALREVPGVARVHSLLTSKHAQPSASGLRFGRAIPEPLPTDPEELARLQARLTESSIFRDRLLSADGKQTRLWVEMAVVPDFDTKRDAILQEIRRRVAQNLGQTPHAMAGFGVTYAGLNELTVRDFAVFLAGCFSLMMLAMFGIFRSKLFVGAALGVMTVSTAAALGALGLSGHRLNMVTSVLPTLIIVLSIGGTVHFQATFVSTLHREPGLSRHGLVRRVLSKVALPCLLTTLTTMVGFLALASSPMAVMSQLGLYAALGVAVGLIANLTLMTWVFFRVPGHMAVPAQTWLTRGLDWLQPRIQTHRVGLGLSLAAITVLAAIGAAQVEADTYSLGYLPDDSQVVRDHQHIVDAWGHYSPLDYTVSLEEGVYADSPKLIAALDHFLLEAQKLPQVHTGFSQSNFYRAAAQALDAELPPDQALTVPMVAQLGLLVESQVKTLSWDKGEPEYAENFIAPFRSKDARLARLTLLVDMQSARGFAELIDKLQPIAQRTLQGVATLKPSGYLPLYVNVIDYVVRSQVNSFFIALGLIFVMMLLWLRSPRLALISLVPNLFPIVVMMGVMGALGIRLDIATATVAAIVLGVAIDDTVHFLHYWREAEQEGLDWNGCLQRTFERAGRPAVITTGLLLVGYPVLMFAAVKPVVYFGLLTSVAALAALVADLLLLPLMLRATTASVTPQPTRAPRGAQLA